MPPELAREQARDGMKVPRVQEVAFFAAPPRNPPGWGWFAPARIAATVHAARGLRAPMPAGPPRARVLVGVLAAQAALLLLLPLLEPVFAEDAVDFALAPVALAGFVFGPAWGVAAAALTGAASLLEMDVLRPEAWSAILASTAAWLLFLPVAGWTSGLAGRALRAQRAALDSLRASEEAQRRILETATEGVWILDAQGVARYANARLGALLGVGADALRGARAADAVHEGDRAAFARLVDRSPQAPQAAGSVRLVRRDGGTVWTLASASLAEEGGAVVMLADVSDLRVAQEREREAAAVVEAAGQAIFSVDLGGNVLTWNRGAEWLYGYAAEDALGMDARDLAPPDRRGEPDDVLARLARGEPLPPLETMRQRRDGSLVDVHLTFAPLRRDDGTVRGLVVTATDVSERKRQDAQIRRLNRMYATLSGVDEAIVRLADPAALAREACRVAVEAGGMRMAWWGEVDPSTSRVTPVVWEGHEEGYLREIAIAATPESPLGMGPTGRALRSGKVETCDDFATDPRMAPWREAALARGYLSSAAIPLVADGQPRGLLTLYAEAPAFFAGDMLRLLEDLRLDLSRGLEAMERAKQADAAQRAVQESEERFRLLAASLDEIIFLATPDLGEVLYVSPALVRVLGPGAEGANPLALLASAAPEEAAQLPAIAEKLAAGQAHEREFPFLRLDGEPRWGRARLVPVRDERGAMIRVAGIVEDVTERHLAQDAVRRDAQQQAEIAKLREIAQFKSTFLNTAAHELSTPLTPIRFQIETLREGLVGELAPAQKDSVEMLARNLERLGSLVQDLLDAARLESGKLRLEVTDVDVDTLSRQALASFEPTAQAVRVALRLEGDCARVVRADPRRLSQVLFNLVDNAIKFTPEGGTVTLRRRCEERYVELAVEDTGVGLSAEQAAKLFHPFVQAHASALHGRSGTGLGLYISRGIVEQLGGTLEARSDGPGKGSTFAVRLPLPAADSQPREPAPPLMGAAPSGPVEPAAHG